ncbi:hypothetical protein Tco_0173389 [Tanacetum coccineum]
MDNYFEKLNIEYGYFGEDGGGGGMMVIGGCESICLIYENIYWSCPLMHFLELEVVEKLLEEEMLVSSSNHWVKVMLMRSSWVKSTNNYFGGMMLIFGLLEALEMEALADTMDVDNG